MRTGIFIFLLSFLLMIGCSGPRFQIIYVGKKEFHPKYTGEKVKVQVYDFDREQLAPLEAFRFEFKPENWAQIRGVPKKKLLGELEVKTLYTHPMEQIKYEITPLLKKNADWK